MKVERPDISLAVYSLLQHPQPTTASAERSFSMLQKLLAKHKNFRGENVKEYMIYINVRVHICLNVKNLETLIY